MNYEKINALFQDEAFGEKARACATMEDFQKLFAENGVEMTIEQTADIIGQIAEAKQKKDNGEVSESDLENVAGGIVISTTVFCVAVGVACVGAAAVSAYNAYQALRWSHR